MSTLIIRSILVAAAILAAAAVIMICRRRFFKKNVLNGRDPAYRRTDDELYTLWIETDPPTDRKPMTVSLSENECTLCIEENLQTVAYSLPYGASVSERQEIEAILPSADGTVLKRLVFRQEQTKEDGMIPLMTAVIAGRDENNGIVEFVRLTDEAKLAHARREREIVKWDGDISVYRWTEQELRREWIDIGKATAQDPMHLIFDKERFTLKTKSGTESFEYELPEGTDERGRPTGEISLRLNDCREFEKLIFHEETLPDSSTVPILSATIFEHDGRGEMVIAEFVLLNDLKKLPSGFRSSSCIERNDVTPPPMIKTIQKK